MLAERNDKTESDSDTALRWIARFRSGSASDEDRQSFALWLAQKPRHKQTMDSMLDMWEDLASVRHLYSSMPEEAPTEAANQGRHWIRASIATAACLIVALYIWPQSSLDSRNEHYYQSAVGEQRTIELNDGSTIVLNTNSRLSVSYDDEHRNIALLRGEAFFTVAKDPTRPFNVYTGNARVTAIGTAFNIYRDKQTSSITVAEGVVRVTELGGTGNRAPATEILHANQRLTATALGLQAAATTDISRHIAWQRGELIAQDMPLTELIGQIERYHDIHILVGDSNIATLTISGVFALDELDPILQALQLSLGLDAIPVDEKTIQLVRPAPPGKI